MPAIPIRELKLLISGQRYRINGNALNDALRDFGWGPVDICAALCKLKSNQCYSSDMHFNKPSCMVDYYRAHNLHLGESVFTHFYIEDDILIISSFKELNQR